MKQFLRRAPARGYTLLEITVSMPLMAMLLLGMASAIGLASRAVPNGETPASALLQAATQLDLLRREVRYCSAVSLHSPTELQFVTADRGAGTAGAETIKYSWAGTPGAPWTRQVNGSAAETVVPDVQNLQFAYRTRLDAGTGTSYLQSIEVRLECSSAAAARLEANLRVMSEPQY